MLLFLQVGRTNIDTLSANSILAKLEHACVDDLLAAEVVMLVLVMVVVVTATRIEKINITNTHSRALLR